MPRYLYQCPACASAFEVEKTVALASRAEACPTCQTSGNRIFTPPALTSSGSSKAFAEPSPTGCTSCCSNGACNLG